MEITRAAREMCDTLREHAQDIEDARRLPPDLAQRMADAGFFRLLVPEKLGGLESTPAQFSQVLRILAQGDASAAWCAMVAGTSALTLAYLPAGEAAKIFSHPSTIMGGVFAPMGKAVRDGDDYYLTGRWQWASGSQNCDWLCAGAMIFEDGELRKLPDGAPEQRMLIFPRAHAQLLDTWHVSGLKGTGSGDMAVENIQVPVTHSLSLMHDRPTADGPLYAFPAFGLLALGIASVALGNARTALNVIQQLAQSKRPGGGRRTLAERGAAQAEFAKVQAQHSAASAFLEQALNRNWLTAQQTGELLIEERVELRLACTHATRTSADVARIAYDLGGGAAVFAHNELQRRFRDAHVATAHMMVAPPTWELAGRIAFGLQTDTRQL